MAKAEPRLPDTTRPRRSFLGALAAPLAAIAVPASASRAESEVASLWREFNRLDAALNSEPEGGAQDALYEAYCEVEEKLVDAVASSPADVVIKLLLLRHYAKDSILNLEAVAESIEAALLKNTIRDLRGMRLPTAA